MVSGKRTGAAKGSRHNKKYWRKGTDIEEIEDAIHTKSREAATGGIIEDMKDDDIFVVDRVASSKKPEEPSMTRKQQAALDKITRNITQETVSLPKPAKTLKKPAKLPRGNAILKIKGGQKTKKIVKKQDKFDVWNTDLTPTISKEKLDNPVAAEHYLKVVKKKQPKTPGKAITSLLPAVEVAQGGASYNPETAEYQEYVKRIAGEEQKLIDSEEKIKRGIEPQWEKVTTEHERFLEMAEGLRIHPKFGKDDDEEEAEASEVVTEETVKNGAVSCERLTKEQKKKKAKAEGLEKEEKRRLDEKAREKDAHNVYRTKQIHKELDDEEKQRHEESQTRKKQKVLKRMTKRQQLGSGKFVDAEDPFLLAEELTGNLRQIKPQGHVLDDRMKSLQRRNMLPIGGNKAKKLKSRLKSKVVEKRNVKTVVKGSRVI